MTKNLQQLLQNIINLDTTPDINISGLTLDSREVKPDYLFFAYQGSSIDSKQFIDQAITNGAAVILCDTNKLPSILTYKNNIPIIALPNLTEKIGQIAATFYDNPSKNMLSIGVTGTNGKTSISYLLTSALQKLGTHAGLIGTLGYGNPESLTPSNYTSPNPIMLQRILADFRQQNIHTVVMETSSHALDQNRFAGMDIKFGTFTNLTHDHLDYHKTVNKYAAAKRRLFTRNSIQNGIFNLDDPIGLKWFEQFKSNFAVYGYTLNSNKFDNANIIAANNIQAQSNGINAEILSPWGHGKLISRLVGRFNLSNLLAIITNLCIMGYKLSDILSIIPELQPVPGRMQTIVGKNKPLVVVDFSHTPDALKQALQTLREHCHGKLFCMFGCGGDRDHKKRPKMAKIAEKLADHVIITNDNVRFEDPQQIVNDILEGINHPDKVIIELDRIKAIAYTIKQATPKDIVLLAGKGHEPYQIIGNKKLPFSDIEIVKNLFAEGK
ncbi:MAG: UDP-N-acetylmuramoyl-L-alanyl-D-glutamate--2,6-diaminopimelate ligase [Gammaproteobacteria bacterium]|jgi:UDP-N-acetylmuramoyl-L-alanyl-D-glutamate--2,6-diaminopimelate ligase